MTAAGKGVIRICKSKVDYGDRQEVSVAFAKRCIDLQCFPSNPVLKAFRGGKRVDTIYSFFELA